MDGDRPLRVGWGIGWRRGCLLRAYLILATLIFAFAAQAVSASTARAANAWTFAVTGDFNGDGKTDIAQFDSSNGDWWVRLSTGSGFTSSVWARWNPSVHWVDVMAGDFDGDGKTDIVAMDADTGQWWVALSTGSGFTNSLWGTWSHAVNWVDVVTGDFNGDGRTDIAARDAATGQWWVGLSSGSSFTTTLWGTWSPSVTWADVRVGDFDGDGKADIAGRVASSGQWWVAQSNGSSFTSSLWATWSSSVDWVDVLAADFNGDGKTDLAARWGAAGSWWVAQSTGTSFATSQWATWSSSVNWVDVLAGDFNGDGKTDIAGRWGAAGSWWVGLSTPSSQTSGPTFTTTQWASWSPSVTWAPVLAGDFNGDGRTDIAGFSGAGGSWWVGLSTGSAFNTTLWANVNVAAPTASPAFGAASIPDGGTTTLTYTLTNPNSWTGLSGVALTDSLPVGLVVAPGAVASTTCGGSVSAAPGSSTVSLTGGSLTAGGSCTVQVSVQGTSVGTKLDSVSATSSEGGSGPTGSASLTVTPGPLASLVISPAKAAISAGGSQVFRAEGFDVSGTDLGNVTSGTTFTLSGSGSCAANICSAKRVGTYIVTAADGSARGTATLTVSAAPPGLSGLYVPPFERGQVIFGSLRIGVGGSRLTAVLSIAPLTASARSRWLIVGTLTRRNLPAGKLSFRVPLNRRGRRDLKRFGRLRVKLTLTLWQPSGARSSASRFVTLRR